MACSLPFFFGFSLWWGFGRVMVLGFIRGVYRELSSYVSMLEARGIARRMFITNSFDGLLSALGVILGNRVYGVSNLHSYVAGVLGASFALGLFSGFIATYLSERAERLRELRRTERAMLHSLKGSVYERAARMVPLYVALWSSFGALVLPSVAVAPFIAALAFGYSVSVDLLAYSSAGIILVELFLLGVYLGKVSGENRLVSGARMALIGVVAVVVFTLLGLVA